LGVSTVCWAFDGGLTVLWVSCGFSWVLFCGLAGLFLCILPVYLGAPYAFLITILIKKKKKVHFLQKLWAQKRCTMFIKNYY
jgi:hypothetical protein